MKFISILGYDRSGTTFLGSYFDFLGKNVFYAGEIDKGISHYLSGKVKQCTCGSTLQNCEIWGKILPEIDPSNVNLKSVLNKLQILTGADVIIDSSKTKSYVTQFQSIFQQNHYTVFVRRNPKAVVLSRMTSRKKRIAKNTHPNPKVAKLYNSMLIYDSLEWNMYNLWAERIKVKGRNVDLVYDYFESELPDKAIKFLEINQICEISQGTGSHHIVWGNKGRSNFNNKISINHKWKKSLNKLQKYTVDFLTIPIRILLNYRF